MPDHKSQHYVPRCYFKPFSLRGEGAAVNLMHIRTGKFVRNAPIKGQCAKDYLYGEDLALERVLQNIEGEYARILRTLIARERLSDEDLINLRDVAFLQQARTDMAVKVRREFFETFRTLAHEPAPHLAPEADLSDSALMQQSVMTLIDTSKYIQDLKVCLLKNETSTGFVTSDDPAVLTNRYHFQRLRDGNFGISSTGLLLFMPMSPGWQLMCYDGGAYTLPEKREHIVRLADARDVRALNDIQYLRGGENLYFASWEEHERIGKDFSEVKHKRPATWGQFTVMVRDGDDAKGERYRRATETERRDKVERLIMASMYYPEPPRWLSKLKFRDPVRTFYNGSAVGHVRKAEWLKSEPRHT